MKDGTGSPTLGAEPDPDPVVPEVEPETGATGGGIECPAGLRRRALSIVVREQHRPQRLPQLDRAYQVGTGGRQLAPRQALGREPFSHRRRIAKKIGPIGDLAGVDKPPDALELPRSFPLLTHHHQS